MEKERQHSKWTGRAILMAALVFSQASWAATMPVLDASGGRVEDRQQLRTLLDGMKKAISSLDVEAALKLMQPEAIVTWQNGEVSRGADQIRAYYSRMIKGSAAIVKKFSTKAKLGGPAVFYSDSAIAYGTTLDTYDLASGLNFTLNANWSTTIVKANGQWKVAALHFSTDLFDNPLLKNAERMIWISGAGAFIAGLLLAFAFVRIRKKN